MFDAAHALIAWAESRAWADGQWFGYQSDAPELVALDACRYDVGVTVTASLRAEGRVGRFALPAMQVAELALDGDIGLVMRTLDWTFGTSLPRSAFVPDDQPCFEAWHGHPYTDGTDRFRVRVQLPVVPAV